MQSTSKRLFKYYKYSTNLSHHLNIYLSRLSSCLLSLLSSFLQVQSHCETLRHPNIQDHHQHHPAGGAYLALLAGLSHPRGRLLWPPHLQYPLHQWELCHLCSISSCWRSAPQDPLHGLLPHFLCHPPAGHISVLYFHRPQPDEERFKPACGGKCTCKTAGKCIQLSIPMSKMKLSWLIWIIISFGLWFDYMVSYFLFFFWFFYSHITL